MRSIAKRSALLATIGITIACAPLGFAQTAVEGGYKDENGNMHWGESRPEPESQSSRSSSIRSNTKSLAEKQADYFNSQSISAIGRRQHEAALRFAEAAYRAEPTASALASVYMRQSDVAEDRGDYQAALRYYELGLSTWPQFRSLLQSTGDIRGKKLRAELARQQQQQRKQAASNANDNKNQGKSAQKEEAARRMELALALAKKGDQKGSVKELNAALKLDPNSPRQKEVYASWKGSSGANTENRTAANKTTSARVSTDQLDADKRAPELHDFPVKKFEKTPQLPLPPILKGEPPNAAVRHELDDYLKNWKERNQEYQKAPPEKAAQLKKDMERDNNKFKEKMRKSYGVDL